MTEEVCQLHAIIQGRVQGVSFRYYTNLRANELGVRGWVRNRSDGTVEALAEGTREQLNHFLEFLKTGPVGATVLSVDAEWQTPTGQFANFEIHPTH